MLTILLVNAQYSDKSIFPLASFYESARFSMSLLFPVDFIGNWFVARRSRAPNQPPTPKHSFRLSLVIKLALQICPGAVHSCLPLILMMAIAQIPNRYLFDDKAFAAFGHANARVVVDIPLARYGC
jgi:hypothetical protein